jgi:hypothetical protein
MNNELKACPFCGGPASISDEGSEAYSHAPGISAPDWSIQCLNHQCIGSQIDTSMHGQIDTTMRGDVVDAWNRRDQPQN